MVIQPLSLQLGNYGVEILAQTSKEALAQAQQTAQMNEMLKDNYKKTQEIQPSDEILSAEKVHRKTDDERDNESNHEQSEQKAEQKNEEEQKTKLGVTIQKNGRYDFYI